MNSATLRTRFSYPTLYTLRLSRYLGDNAPRIELLAGASLALTATISLVELHLTPDEGCCYIKDWGENEGLFASMIDAGLLTDTRFIVTVGKCHARQARMNETLRHEFAKIKAFIP